MAPEDEENQRVFRDMSGCYYMQVPLALTMAASFVEEDVETIDIPVVKAWKGDENQSSVRPSEVVVSLLANDKDTGKTLTLIEGNQWSGVFENLDRRNADGELIDYTVKEITQVEGYSEPKIEGTMGAGFNQFPHI